MRRTEGWPAGGQRYQEGGRALRSRERAGSGFFATIPLLRSGDERRCSGRDDSAIKLQVVDEELGYAREDYAAGWGIGDWVAAAGDGNNFDVFAGLDQLIE
jgi:hypothetical protein